MLVSDFLAEEKRSGDADIDLILRYLHQFPLRQAHPLHDQHVVDGNSRWKLHAR